MQGTAGSGVTPYYGSFYSTTTQNPLPASTIVPITLNNTIVSNGVSIGVVPSSSITIDHTGIYNFQFTGQLAKTDGGVDVIDIWTRVNGLDIPNTTQQVSLVNATDEVVISWAFHQQMNAGDSFQIMMSSADGTFNLTSIPAQTGLIRPRTPSVIVSVSRIG